MPGPEMPGPEMPGPEMPGWDLSNQTIRSFYEQLATFFSKNIFQIVFCIISLFYEFSFVFFVKTI